MSEVVSVAITVSAMTVWRRWWPAIGIRLFYSQI